MRPVPDVTLYDHQAEEFAAWLKKVLAGEPDDSIQNWHRGAGKTKVNLARMVAAGFEYPATYVWVGPTLKTVRESVWDARDAATGVPYLAMVSPELIVDMNQNEMALTMRTKKAGLTSRLLFLSGFDADKLRGVHPRGAVIDEYATHDAGDECYRVLRPAITRARGWMAICSTPKGRSNHYAELVTMAATSPKWRLSTKTIRDTRDLTGAPLITLEDVERQRAEGQHEAWLKQEYHCAFTSALVSSYYGDLLERMRAEDRIGPFVHDIGKQVVTAFDLGVSNATVAVFAQAQGDHVTILDCLAIEGADFAEVIRQCRATSYDIGTWIFPHDIAQRQQTGVSISGRAESRLDVARRLGIRHPVVLPMRSVDEGIDAVRRMMAKRLRIDARCSKLIEALESYEKVWDASAKVFRDKPLHNWCSDYADATRYLSLGWTDKGDYETRLNEHRKKYGSAPLYAKSSGPYGRSVYEDHRRRPPPDSGIWRAGG